MLRIFTSPLADADIEQAADYYTDNASPAIALEFVEEMRQIRCLIAQSPEIGSRRYAHFLRGAELRFWTGDRFPFLIFYTFDAGGVRVVRVLHERRKFAPGLFRSAFRQVRGL